MVGPARVAHARVSCASLHKGQFILPAHRTKMPFNNAFFLPYLLLRGALLGRALAQLWWGFALGGKAPLEWPGLISPGLVTPLKLLCLCTAAIRKRGVLQGNV